MIVISVDVVFDVAVFIFVVVIIFVDVDNGVVSVVC